MNANSNSLSPRTTSPSNDSNSLRPINYSSQQRRSISAGKNYPYDDHTMSSLPTQGPVTSTPVQQQQLLHPNNKNLNVKISMINQQKELSAEPPITGSLEERGREAKRTGIFGTLRKRLSRSKTRNESANGTTNGYHDTDLESPTADTFPQSKSATLKSTSGNFLKFGMPGSSRRSSVSEMSGVSGLSRMSNMSNKTFLHEASSLVLEVIENGVKR